MAPPTVLVVDDEREICSLLSKYLKLCGFNVEVAFDGEEARERMASRRFSAVLCDMNMPKTYGIELLSALHADYPDVPIIVMSGSVLPGEVNEALEHGATAYIPKPFDNLSDVADRLKHCCGEDDTTQS